MSPQRTTVAINNEVRSPGEPGDGSYPYQQLANNTQPIPVTNQMAQQPPANYMQPMPVTNQMVQYPMYYGQMPIHMPYSPYHMYNPAFQYPTPIAAPPDSVMVDTLAGGREQNQQDAEIDSDSEHPSNCRRTTGDEPEETSVSEITSMPHLKLKKRVGKRSTEGQNRGEYRRGRQSRSEGSIYRLRP